MRELALHYFPADCFGIEWEIVFGVTYVLSVQYSCGLCNFFLFWRKFVLVLVTIDLIHFEHSISISST